MKQIIDIVSLRVAELAKIKGFNEPVITFYYDEILELNICGKTGGLKTKKINDITEYMGPIDELMFAAPTEKQLEKWLLNNYDLTINVYPNKIDYQKIVITNLKKSDPNTPLGALWKFPLTLYDENFSGKTEEKLMEMALMEALSMCTHPPKKRYRFFEWIKNLFKL